MSSTRARSDRSARDAGRERSTAPIAARYSAKAERTRCRSRQRPVPARIAPPDVDDAARGARHRSVRGTSLIGGRLRRHGIRRGSRTQTWRMKSGTTRGLLHVLAWCRAAGRSRGGRRGCSTPSRPARRTRTRRAPRSSRNWCDTADSLSPTSAARSQTQRSPSVSASSNLHARRIAEKLEDLGHAIPRARPGADASERVPGSPTSTACAPPHVAAASCLLRCGSRVSVRCHII